MLNKLNARIPIERVEEVRTMYEQLNIPESKKEELWDFSIPFRMFLWGMG